jgi:hypothetical protein
MEPDPSFYHDGVLKLPAAAEAQAITLLSPPQDIRDFGDAASLRRWAAHTGNVTGHAYAARTLVPRAFAYALAFTTGLGVLADHLPAAGTAVAEAHFMLSNRPDHLQQRREQLVRALRLATDIELPDVASALTHAERASLAAALAGWRKLPPGRRSEPLSPSPWREGPLSLLLGMLISLIAGAAGHAALRQFTWNIYQAYQAPVEKLMRESHDGGSWLENILDALPRLMLKNFVPIYTKMRISNPKIGLLKEDVRPGMPLFTSQSTQIRVIAPLLRAAFSDDEIAGLIEMENIAEEKFAHLYAALLTDWDVRAEELRGIVLAELAASGRTAARQLLTRYYARLSIPTYVYQDLLRQVRS